MATKHQNTGTATDYLGYGDYHDTAGYDYIDRLPSASQEWVFGDWDGEKYLIKFGNNFSKKHLFTFEKKTADIAVAAYYIGQKGGGPASENWGRAEHEMLEKSIAHKLTARTTNGRKCVCTHRFNQHNPGTKLCTIGGCACTGFITAYGLHRKTAGRPDVDPLTGMATSRNTCIVLNYIPKIEFESVVVGSICAHEKPPGWSRGQPLAKHVGDEVVLRWDFGSARPGVIVQAVDGADPASWGRLQGVYVKAKKTATAVGWQTWEVFHLETSGAHAPF